MLSQKNHGRRNSEEVTDVSDAEQGNQESAECSGEGEQFPVPLEDFEVVSEACNY